MILLAKVNETLDIIPNSVKGFLGLYSLGLMLIVPDLMIALALAFIFFSMVYSIWYKIFSLISQYTLNVA